MFLRTKVLLVTLTAGAIATTIGVPLHLLPKEDVKTPTEPIKEQVEEQEEQPTPKETTTNTTTQTQKTNRDNVFKAKIKSTIDEYTSGSKSIWYRPTDVLREYEIDSEGLDSSIETKFSEDEKKQVLDGIKNYWCARETNGHSRFYNFIGAGDFGNKAAGNHGTRKLNDDWDDYCKGRTSIQPTYY